MPKKTFYIQATSVSLNNKAYLIIGKPNSKKSLYAYYLIKKKKGLLISDDLTKISLSENSLYAENTGKYIGYLYIRNIGLLKNIPFTTHIKIYGIILLSSSEEIKKIPLLKNLIILKRYKKNA